MEIPHEAIRTVFRDGRRNERFKNGGKKTRIVKVCFKQGEENHRRSMLSGATNWLRSLQRFEGNRYKPFIREDMTYNERIRDRVLREELKARKNAGETGLIIRQGKIIRKTPLRLEPALPSSDSDEEGPENE